MVKNVVLYLIKKSKPEIEYQVHSTAEVTCTKEKQMKLCKENLCQNYNREERTKQKRTI